MEIHCPIGTLLVEGSALYKYPLDDRAFHYSAGGCLVQHIGFLPLAWPLIESYLIFIRLAEFFH